MKKEKNKKQLENRLIAWFVQCVFGQKFKQIAWQQNMQ